MVDQKKIIIMTKLALYEKKYMQKDKRKLDYFIEDYVYLRNFWTRFWITIVTIGIIIIGAFRRLNQEIDFPTSVGELLNIYVRPYILPWLIAIVVYTLISTFIARSDYKKANERYEEYEVMMKELEKYESHQEDYEGAYHEIQ